MTTLPEQLRDEALATAENAADPRLSLAVDSVFDRLIQAGDCWEWQGHRGRFGHGTVRLRGRHHLVHRVVYEHLVGTIPEGLELDHLCRNPPCCNPAHLDPVTHAENMRRGKQSFDVRTRCLSGLHELTPDNVITRKCDGRQTCRACKNERKRRRRAAGMPHNAA